ncbi:Dihydroorotase [hydrothermal vent metagenome]|uniref:dihydroorotase n=1 Tax=hydrothermal vent metagenome TaxID=652676 RepID=A0A3B1B4Y1_9ZZZZ
MKELTLIQPDDWHLHVRDDDVLKNVIPDSAQRFARAIIMPNLKPPVTTVTKALEYRQRILDAVPEKNQFEPLMALYLTDNTSEKDIVEAAENAHVHAIKYYPAGATTNSDAGVSSIKNVYPIMATMEEKGIPLLVHGEVTDPQVDVFDREAIFIDTILNPLLKQFPALRLVLEHITTAHAVDFVSSMPDNIAATITPHHLLMNRNDIFKGGIRPHHYCLPILKREQHRQSLLKAACSGNPKFFLGTDSAPHSQKAKESACGCAGMYSAHAAIELYAEAFEQAAALDKLESFSSCFGPDFYRLPRNTRRIKLIKEDWKVPNELAFESGKLIPLRAGEIVHWKLVS